MFLSFSQPRPTSQLRGCAAPLWAHHEASRGGGGGLGAILSVMNCGLPVLGNGRGRWELSHFPPWSFGGKRRRGFLRASGPWEVGLRREEEARTAVPVRAVGVGWVAGTSWGVPLPISGWTAILAGTECPCGDSPGAEPPLALSSSAGTCPPPCASAPAPGKGPGLQRSQPGLLPALRAGRALQQLALRWGPGWRPSELHCRPRGWETSLPT